MMSRGRCTPDEGFTLLEVLVAIFLLALILGSVYSAFFVIHDATTATTGTVVRLQEARATMDLMRRELEAAFDPKKHPLEVNDRDAYGKQTSTLVFNTNGSALAGGSRVGYSVKEAEDGRLTLIKTVGPVEEDLVTVSQEAVEVEAVEDVVSFMVEVRNRDKWIRTWRESTWPQDIRVILTIKLHGAEVPLVFTTSPYVGKVL
jgi:general secretion pathway protein J